MASQKLSPKQERFVAEYLIDLNATAAYKRAGYKGQGRSAENAASRLLGNVGVQEAIQVARQRLQQKSELSAQWVLDHLKTEAERVGEGSSHSARVKAVELIGKTFALFVDKVEHSGEVRQRVIEEVEDAPHSGAANPSAPGAEAVPGQ